MEYHHLPKASAETVEMNLREQYKWQRLQGRLDQRPTAAIVAELLHMRQSVAVLETPGREPSE